MIANKKTVDQIKSDLKLFLGDNADQFIEWYMYTYTLEPLYNIHHWDQHTCLMEMSFVEGSFNILKYQNGTRKVSLVVRCPLFRGFVVVCNIYCKFDGT